MLKLNVRGYSSEGGNAEMPNGGVGMVVATPIQMPQSHYNDRLYGGGGGKAKVVKVAVVLYVQSMSWVVL